MTTNKIHTSNLELTDKQIVREMFRIFRNSDKIDFARIDIAHYKDHAFQKVVDAGMRGKSYVITYKECSKYAYDENGNFTGELILDWANRKEEEDSNVVGEYLKEVAESLGFEVEWRGSHWYGVCLLPREGMVWNRNQQKWEAEAE